MSTVPAPVRLLCPLCACLLNVPTAPAVSTTVCLLQAYCCCPRVLTVPTMGAQLYAYLAGVLLCPLYSVHIGILFPVCLLCSLCPVYLLCRPVMYGGRAGLVESRLVRTCYICGMHL